MNSGSVTLLCLFVSLRLFPRRHRPCNICATNPTKPRGSLSCVRCCCCGSRHPLPRSSSYTSESKANFNSSEILRSNTGECPSAPFPMNLSLNDFLLFWPPGTALQGRSRTVPSRPPWQDVAQVKSMFARASPWAGERWLRLLNQGLPSVPSLPLLLSPKPTNVDYARPISPTLPLPYFAAGNWSG